ncbi:MAG: hypothetical protein LBN74_02675 [Prevotella sp.]|jgi:hypothetical protein|nr:hypothetical protein [Prevotella sp.]
MAHITKYFFYTFLLVVLLSSCVKGKTEKMLSYESVFFYYPKNWSVETNELPGVSWLIEANNGRDVLFISLTQKKIETEDFFNIYYQRKDTMQPQLSAEAVTPAKFGKYDCLSSKYKINDPPNRNYGIVYAFEAGGKHILVVKQSDTEESIERNFKVIEDSFDIETKDTLS